MKATKNDSVATMFRLELELSVLFVPPIEENGRSITLIRSFKLPFSPTEKLSLTGSVFNPYCPPWEGFPLKWVTGTSIGRIPRRIRLMCQDHPLASICYELRA
jgi:hypothetical protein